VLSFGEWDNVDVDFGRSDIVGLDWN